MLGVLIYFFSFFPSPSFEPGFSINKTNFQKKQKLIFMVIDAMRFDMVNKLTKTTNYIQNKRGILIPSFAHPPTVTMPRLKAMTSGIMPSFLDVIHNLNSQEFNQDNWLYQMNQQNKTILLYGDETWRKLFPRFLDERSDPTTSFFVTDTEIVDSNVTRHIDESLLHHQEWDALILHYLGLDHVGHIGGVKSPKMKPKLDEMDEIIDKIAKWSLQREDTLFIVCSDHGMTKDGNHGGATIDETSTFFLFFGLKHPKDIQFQQVNQMDIVPTLSVLMGLPIPLNNIGVVIENLLEDRDEIHSAIKLNYEQISKKLNYYHMKNFKLLIQKIDESKTKEEYIFNTKIVNLNAIINLISF
jgi:ethanolamine phosphate transferase 2 subunit G